MGFWLNQSIFMYSRLQRGFAIYRDTKKHSWAFLNKPRKMSEGLDHKHSKWHISPVLVGNKGAFVTFNGSHSYKWVICLWHTRLYVEVQTHTPGWNRHPGPWPVTLLLMSSIWCYRCVWSISPEGSGRYISSFDVPLREIIRSLSGCPCWAHALSSAPQPRLPVNTRNEPASWRRSGIERCHPILLKGLIKSGV